MEYQVFFLVGFPLRKPFFFFKSIIWSFLVNEIVCATLTVWLRTVEAEEFRRTEFKYAESVITKIKSP